MQPTRGTAEADAYTFIVVLMSEYCLTQHSSVVIIADSGDWAGAVGSDGEIGGQIR